MNGRSIRTCLWLCVISLLACIWTSRASAQGFSLCSVVDAKHKTMTLAWSKPEASVSGYSFHYNGHELTPYRPTIDDVDQLSYEANVGFGTHMFQLYGFESEFNTNEVELELKRPHYYAALVPGLYQSIYRNRYASSCGGNTGVFQRVWHVAEPAVLLAATGYATSLWFQFFKHKNAALNARDTYLDTLRGEELELWREKRDKAKDVFPKAMAVSVATLTVNAITTLFMSPRGKARIKGGFSLDCGGSGNGLRAVCMKL